MWIQIIKARLKPGKDAEFAGLGERLMAIEQPNSGLVRSTMTRSTSDPDTVYMIVAFESQEAARARESDPLRAEGLGPIRQTMGEIFDGPPEFIDLDVIDEYLPG